MTRPRRQARARSASSTEGAYWFDEKAAAAAVRFFPTYLRHTEGEWFGRPFVLQPWQAEFIRALFGWKRADGTRRYRQAYLEVPRKNGKTELAAGIAVLALLGDGERGGQGFALAVDKDQARIVFNKATVMIGGSEVLRSKIEVFKTSLYCPELLASFRPLSSAAETKHGLSPSFVIGDELHEWPNDQLYDVVHKGTGARRQPLEVYITTAGRRGWGFGWQMHEHAVNVRDGLVKDEAFLPVIYAAGESDDWTSEKTWRKANPNYGVSLKPDYMAAECLKARGNPRLENDFRRFHLNQWTEQVTRWIPMERWDACASQGRQGEGADRWKRLWDEVRARTDRRADGALDLSSSRDITSLCWYLPHWERPGGTLLARYWLPREALKAMDERRRQLFQTWADQGALTLTPGNVIDYAFVVEQVMRDAELLQVQRIGMDPWNATQTALEMIHEGLPIEMMRQGFATLSPPSKEFERLVMAGQIEHGNHPITRWMVNNAAVATDPAGNIKPAKDQAADKIDGVVAAVMAIGLHMSAELKGPSVYEGRGVLVL